VVNDAVPTFSAGRRIIAAAGREAASPTIDATAGDRHDRDLRYHRLDDGLPGADGRCPAVPPGSRPTITRTSRARRRP
jgi:hypothetical protein